MTNRRLISLYSIREGLQSNILLPVFCYCVFRRDFPFFFRGNKTQVSSIVKVAGFSAVLFDWSQVSIIDLVVLMAVEWNLRGFMLLDFINFSWFITGQISTIRRKLNRAIFLN